tara:strand:+ start:194 stop:613 length:420 start_codon:yes stop_codon:yes gene_type:complete
MSLIKYNPSLAPLLDNFEDLFSVFDAFDPMTRPRPGISKPRANIENLEDKHVIELATPGIAKEDLVVDLNEGRLTISYEEDDSAHTNTFSFQRSFKQSWTLPKNVDIEKVDAQYTDGILTVSIPKRAPEVPPHRRIDIA